MAWMIAIREMGRTETINNTSDPEWTHQFVMDFYFIEIQHLKAREQHYFAIIFENRCHARSTVLRRLSWFRVQRSSGSMIWVLIPSRKEGTNMIFV